MRLLADRNRSGAYLIMLCIGTAVFGMFFFITLFMQIVLGYSPIRTGIAYLPFAIGTVTSSARASQLIPRVGPRALILTGISAVAGGTFWFSKLTEHAGYAGSLLGPILVTSLGLGMVFVPLSLVALHKVGEQDSGVASSMLNVGQQVGGAIGLALLGTIAWTTVEHSIRTQVAHAAEAGQTAPTPGTAPPLAIYDHALAVGFSRGFLVAAGIALLALLIAIVTIRIRREELAGAVPTSKPGPPSTTAPQPDTGHPQDDRAALAAAIRPCRLC
jgi:hypothetical protein